MSTIILHVPPLPPGFARWGCWDCGYSYLPSRDPPPYPKCPLCGGTWIDLGPALPKPARSRAPPPIATVPTPAQPPGRNAPTLSTE